MSQPLYVVRLREDFRIREIYDIRVDRIPPKALFPSRELAEHFISTKIPIDNNPFQRSSEWYINKEEDRIEFVEVLWKRDLLWFLERLRDIQIPIPEDYGWHLPEWWNEITRGLKQSDKDRLCQWLELPPWKERLFVPDSFYIDEGYLGIWYSIHLSSLVRLVTEYQLPLPDILSGEKNWELWWDETAPRMTDEQKAALWRLLDPQPWEIIEVELEGKL